jgi:outer membrane protein OmpA-like peptidoglycan-associated protein
MATLIRTAFAAHASFALLDTGARPELTTAQLGSDAGNGEAMAADESAQLATISHALDRVVPAVAEADPWLALTEAVEWLKAQGGGKLVFEDSGLGTAGLLNYLTPGLLGADPGQLVKYAEDHKDLPDAHGVSVDLLGLGYTAPPQPALDQATRANLIEQYTALLQASGAQIIVDTTPLTGAGPKIAPPVTVVPPPITGPPVGLCGATFGSNEVRFIVGTATFADPLAATSAVQSVVDQLSSSPNALATITGTASSEGNNNEALSQSRAFAIQQLMIKLGTPPSQIGNVIGIGATGPDHVPDIDAAGNLLPGPAAENRKVIVSWQCNMSVPR